jgi:hypothetical protein
MKLQVRLVRPRQQVSAMHFLTFNNIDNTIPAAGSVLHAFTFRTDMKRNTRTKKFNTRNALKEVKEYHVHSLPSPSTPKAHRNPAFPKRSTVTASPCFGHVELDQSTETIRLLRILPNLSLHGQIQSSIRHTTIQKTTYNCLSYEWGSDVGGDLISIGGSLYHVRQNPLKFPEQTRQKRHKSSL